MLTTLAAVKTRLAIPEADIQYDAILTAAISGISARFDLECNRILARTVDATFEFSSDDIHLAPPCYPIETVTKFELQEDTGAWLEVPNVQYTLRHRCVLSLLSPLHASRSTLYAPLARVTYTGGYGLPGDPDPQPSANNPQPVRLPADLQQAAIEQAVFWFQTRENTGTIRIWPSGGNYVQFADIDLIPPVRAVLRRHTRFLL